MWWSTTALHLSTTSSAWWSPLPPRPAHGRRADAAPRGVQGGAGLGPRAHPRGARLEAGALTVGQRFASCSTPSPQADTRRGSNRGAPPRVERVERDGELRALLDESVRAWCPRGVERSRRDCRGVTIAVVDTGVDYGHPDLGGSLGPGAKVIGATTS